MRYVVIAVVLAAAPTSVAAALLLPWFAGGYGLLLGVALPAVIVALSLFVGRLAALCRHHRFQRTSVPAHAVVTGTRPLQREVNDAVGQPVTLRVTPPDGRPRTVEDTSGLGGYQVRRGDRVTGRWSLTEPTRFRPDGIVVGPTTRPLARRGGAPPVLGRSIGLVVTVAVLAVVILEPALPSPDDGGSRARLAGVLSMALGAYYLWMGLRKVVRTAALRRRANGTVTQVWDRVTGGADQKHLYSLAVRFATPEGRAVHRRYPDEVFTPVRKGQAIDVRYDPSHPARFELPELQARALVWVGTIAGTAGIAFGLWSMFRA